MSLSKCKNIIRVIKDKSNPYVQINKTCLNDSRLSLKAMGLHCYMLSMPDDWVFHREELAKHFSDGITSIRSALKELQDHGYVKILATRDKGAFTSWQTLVFEAPILAETYMPQGSEPEVENQLVVNPPVVNAKLLKNDITKNKRNNNIYAPSTNAHANEFKEFYDLYPKKKDKARAQKAFEKVRKTISFDTIMDGMVSWTTSNTPLKYWPLPSTWLNGQRWEDEMDESANDKINKNFIGVI